MQKTNFSYEIIIHDDASTDCSAEIIREYAERYPDIIKPIFEAENQYCKRDGSIQRIMNEAIDPAVKYIALCEGDDYWTDSNKLQKQVDFLENHPQFFVCSHNFSIFHHSNAQLETHIIDAPYQDIDGFQVYIYNQTNYFKIWAASTLSVVYRNLNYLDNYYLDKGLWDFTNRYLMMLIGDGALLKDSMATYRIHENGIYSGKTKEKRYDEELRQLYLLYDKEKQDIIIEDAINPRITAYLPFLRHNKCYSKIISTMQDYYKNIPIGKQLGLYYKLVKIFLSSKKSLNL